MAAPSLDDLPASFELYLRATTSPVAPPRPTARPWTGSPLISRRPPSVRSTRPAAFAVCAGKDFDARRDTALLTMLLDAGPRRSELLGMRLNDIDSEYGARVGGNAPCPMATRP
jgi:integrase